MNYNHKNPDDVTLDLYRHDIMSGYIIWYFYGKGDRSQVGIRMSSRNAGCADDFYDAWEILDDFVNATENFKNGEESNITTIFFYKTLDSASELIYPDNIRFTTLSLGNKLLRFKHKYNCSNKVLWSCLNLLNQCWRMIANCVHKILWYEEIGKSFEHWIL